MNKRLFSRRGWMNSAAAVVLSAAGTQPAARAHAREKVESSGSVDLRHPERQAGTECIREYIRGCRQAALAELKPSRRQIDRALALHEESIVCDPIGGHFEQADEHGLCSAAMGEVIRRKLKRYDKIGTEQYWNLLKEVAGQTRVFELVTDPLMQRDQKALLQAGGVTMGTDTASPVWSQQRVALAGYMIDNLDYIEKVTRPGQVTRLKRTGRFGCLWISHGRFVLDANPIKALDLLYLHGVRQSLISTAVPEEDTGSAQGDPQQGLGDLGRTVLKRMNQLGMIGDASHTSPQTALDIAAVSDRPVLVSHTCCRVVHYGYTPWRNMTDEGLKAIAKTGGVVSIGTVPTLVGGVEGYTIAGGMAHIRHAVQLLGADHVGVSSDRAPYWFACQPPELTRAVMPDKLLPYEQAPKYPGGWGRIWRRYREPGRRPPSLMPCRPRLGPTM